MSKRWLITGSSRGLGRAFAKTVLAAGQQLVATARKPEQLADLVERYGEQARTVALDVTDPAAENAINTAVEAFGGLDVLVNNAGYGDVGSIEDTSLADFRTQSETNLFGVINVTKAAIPLMREQIHSGRPEYDATVGAVARFQREYDGTQPGDPARAAAVVLHLATLDAPPLRLLLGSDAVHLAEQNDIARREADEKWRRLSVSTDFEAGGSPKFYPWE